jgi:sugar lactone lactonase YvrE
MKRWFGNSLGGLILATAFLGAPLGAMAQTPDMVLSFAERDSLPLPEMGQVTGLTFMGPDTLVVLTDTPDSLSDSGDREVLLVFQDREGGVFFQEDFTGVLDRGLAWDGEFLYSSGDAPDGSSILYQLRVDTLQVEEAFDAPGHRPTAMAYDGRYVWITDRDSGKIDRFDPEVGEITRTAQAPGFSPFGLAYDGNNLWVTDSGTGRMYRLSGSRLRWSATVDPHSYLHRDQNVLLLHDGQNFWYLPAGGAKAVNFIFN